MFTVGTEITPPSRTASSDREAVVGDIVEVQVGYSVLIDRYLNTPHRTTEQIEQQFANGMWNKIGAEGHEALFIRTWVDHLSSNQYRDYTELRGVVNIQCVWKVLHASPFAISIAVGWAVVILALIIVAYLTSPYWGPLFWIWAGYKPGQAPPAAPPPAGLQEIVWLVGLAVVGIIAYAALNIFGKRKGRK